MDAEHLLDVVRPPYVAQHRAELPQPVAQRRRRLAVERQLVVVVALSAVVALIAVVALSAVVAARVAAAAVATLGERRVA